MSFFKDTFVSILAFALVLVVSGCSKTELQKLAEQGDADAQHKLGGMHFEGNGVPENDAEAVKWYRKAKAS